jgi:hypothetical protein
MKSLRIVSQSLVFLALITFISCTNNSQKDEETAIDKPLLENESEKVSFGSQEPNGGAENAAIITLDNDIYDFGVVSEGEKVKHVYNFTNTGKSPLILSNVSASCGCTTPEYSKHPINPGEKGSVTVVFDSQNQVGIQQKIISILSNAEPSQTILQLKGEVKKGEVK